VGGSGAHARVCQKGTRAVPHAEATVELLASREDVWRFATDPYRLPDWWLGIAGVQPDRRGLAPGARWQVQGHERPGLVHRARAQSLLLVRRVEPPALVAFHLTGDRLDVELRLDEAAPRRTLATLRVEGPFVLGRRQLARRALRRLYDLCQTGAEP
jgi:uncharacterized protein YndB with AHSA1/START domain